MTKKVKKTYQKPQITQVKLVPEEAVLGGCKNAAVTGPFVTPCGYAPTCLNYGT